MLLLSCVDFPVAPSNRFIPVMSCVKNPAENQLFISAFRPWPQEKLVKITREFMIRWFRNTIVLQRLYCWNSCNDKTSYNRSILNDKEPLYLVKTKVFLKLKHSVFLFRLGSTASGHPEVQMCWLSCCLVGWMRIWPVTASALVECKYDFSFSTLMPIPTNPTGLQATHLYDWLEFGYWALKSLEGKENIMRFHCKTLIF